MRAFVFLIFGLLITVLGNTQELPITTISENGKLRYLLEAGTFSNENSALQRKLKLASMLKAPVTITSHPDNASYLVQIGPFAKRQDALTIRSQLTPNETPISIPAPSEKPVVSPDKKLWNLQNADIRAVIEEVSRITGKNFIIDPRVSGKISIVSTTPISDKELYPVFLSMLQISGYAASPAKGAIKIIPNVDAKIPFSKESSAGDQLLVEVVPVQYVPAEQLIPVLRPLMPQWSAISAYAPSNMLILSGKAGNIQKISDIIKQVDRSANNEIDIVPLHDALAMDVVNTLKDLVKTSQSTTGRNPPSIAADDRSNAILVSGTRTERIRLRILIEKLDRRSPYGASNSNTQVVYLNYLRAEDLVPILAGIAQANFSGNVGTTIGTMTRPALDSTNPAANLATGQQVTDSQATISKASNVMSNMNAATTQTESGTKPNVQIIAEPNTNSIILNAPASLIRILKQVIKQLDIRPAQLLIEALVAEVNETDINTLGIEWGSKTQTDSGTTTGPFRAGFAILNSQTSIDDFQAQLYALAEQRKANILSTPAVVVLDNRQAKILVGKQVSVASTSYPNNGGGTTTASPYATFDRVNVALHLYVRPQITRGKGIQLQIDQGNDTLDPANLPNTENPTFNISSIVTSVHVESGDIVVLGGLTQDSLGNDNNRIPILGDIPGVGLLFQKNRRNREKRVLMVFIRPSILRNEREAMFETSAKYNDIRQYQLDWLRQQNYDANNKDIILPAIKEAHLPKPFQHAKLKDAARYFK